MYDKLLKKNFVILLLLTLLAFGVRFLNLYKPGGLWYDEMLTFIYSSQSFPVGIIKSILKYDFHMPLYYFYLHFWIKFFGTGDLILRFSSLIWGVLTIPALFFLGKTYRSEKTGYLLALIGTLSPILIYYSQEFRFYSMLIFFSAISLIYFIKLLEAPQKSSIIFFALSNLVILYIYTLGIVFVGAEFFLLGFHIFKYRKNELVNFIKFSLIFLLAVIPYLYLLFVYITASNNGFVDPITCPVSGKSTFLLILCDWFSPFFACIYGANQYIFNKFLTGGVLVLSFLFLPIISFLTGLWASIKNADKKTFYLLTVLFIFLFAEIFLTAKNNFVFATRYTLIVYPIILLLCVDGILNFKSKKVRIFLISFILIVFLVNIISYKTMQAFNDRINGYNALAGEIKALNLRSNDVVLYPTRTELLKKYLPQTLLINFDIPSIAYLDKSKQEALKIFDKDFILSTNKGNASKNLIPFLQSQTPSKELTNYITEQTKKVPKDGKLFFVIDYSSDDLNEAQIRTFSQNASFDKIAQNELKARLFNLLYTKISDDIMKILDNDFLLKKTILVKDRNSKTSHRKIYIYARK